jgi:uncharacterized hydrophobic protein (TIGR00271 family)
MPFYQLQQLWQLPKEETESDTYHEIQTGIVFRGHNLWLLAAAMVIACIGLNAGNSAALIGAMLISPLMGPVIGFAFGLSIYSRSMMRLSIRNWLVMVGTSLAAASLFFLITPFHHSTNELKSFTEATIFDVMLALAGGVAGFIGIIRKEAIKVIAGVAVATACIPPLCTAGYGLANFEFSFLWGGLYFFVINCFFIGLGTWITSIFLGYRKHYANSSRTQTGTVAAMTLLGIALLVPSIWLAVGKWKKQHLENRVNTYVEQIQERFPALVIVKHTAFQKGTQQFADISLLNDSTDISTDLLKAANALNKDIEIRWHFAPDKAMKEAAALRLEIRRLDSALNAQTALLKRLTSTK